MALLFRQTTETEVVKLTVKELSEMAEEEVAEDTFATITIRSGTSITRRVQAQKVEQWKNPIRFKK